MSTKAGWSALWITALIGISLSPLSVKRVLGTAGPIHDSAHILAFVMPSGWLFARRPMTGRVLCMIGLLFLACVLEVLESVLYGNSIEIRDIVLNFLGVFAGALLSSFRDWSVRP